MSSTDTKSTLFDLAADLTIGDAARLILCGPTRPDDARPRIPLAELPSYQVLSTTGEADRPLPWLRLTSVTPLAPVAELDASLSPADTQGLAEIVGQTDWLLLVIGDTAESLAVAIAVGRFALARGRYVNAFIPDSLPIAPSDRAALLASDSYLCRCPSGVPPRLAAEALWASVMYQGIVGVDYGDLRGNLTGDGQLLWAPLRHDGPERMRGILAQLEDFEPQATIWAVLAMPSSLSLEEFTEVGDHVSEYCHEDCAVVIALPEAEALPHGLFLYVG